MSLATYVKKKKAKPFEIEEFLLLYFKCYLLCAHMCHVWAHVYHGMYIKLSSDQRTILGAQG